MAFKDWFKRKKLKVLKEIKIQATEGVGDYVSIESLVTGVRLNISIPGTVNAYSSYDSQVGETYRKYNALASFGNQQTRAIVDLRTAFIAGEGISVSCKDERTSDWIEDFLNKNKMNGSNFLNAVKGAELSGHSLFLLKAKEWRDSSIYTKLIRVPYMTTMPFRPVWEDNRLRSEVSDIQIKQNGVWVSAGFGNFSYIRTGGDDADTEGPITRVGVVLTDIENYDRAIKDMRRNNHIFARITPTINVDTPAEVKTTQKQMEERKWKIGDMFIGRGKFAYETPGQGAHQNLETELVATIKTISGVTGVPVHWFGFVDLMSNRATATTLYELIKQATILERQVWEEALYEIILDGQELYIDSGGEALSKINDEFEVKLPLIDFGEFLNRVKGLSLAFADNAISMDDYRNSLPGVDPLKTKKMIEEEQAEDEEDLRNNDTTIPFTMEEQNG